MLYHVRRKLQEQAGSWFITLPKIWVDSWGLKESESLELIFNENITILGPRSKKGTLRNKKERADRLGTTPAPSSHLVEGVAQS